MSAKGRKNDWIILLSLVLLSVAVLFWASVSREFTSGSPDDQPPLRTTLSSSKQGTLALFKLLDRLGIEGKRTYGQLHRGQLRRLDILVVLDPLLALNESEKSALREWVRQGGVLVCTADVLPRTHGLTGPPGALRWQRGKNNPWGPDGGDDADAEAEAEGAEEESGPALEAPAPQGNIVQRSVAALGQVLEAVAGTAAFKGPLARDVADAELGAIALQGGSGRTRPLLIGPPGNLIVECRLGQGRIVVLADSGFLSNEYLGKADHSVLAVNLFAYGRKAARGNRLGFDEYHHMMGGEDESGWTVLAGLLVTTAPGWGVLFLTAASLALLLLKGRRFGTRRGLSGGQRRRSKFDFVHSVGAACRKAAAEGLVFRLIFDWFRKRCAVRAALPATAPADLLAQRLAENDPARYETYLATLLDGEEIEIDHRLTRGQMSRLIAALSRMEKDLFEGKP